MIQHVAPETPYAIVDALGAAGAGIDVCRVFEGDVVPAAVEGIDGLVVMGGPMSACSDDGFPSRRAELALIEAALAAGIPILGVCLGAQLLVLAAGGDVRAGAAGPEIGWAPVSLSDAAAADPLFGGVPSPLEVLHWHGDTFSLPPGATLLGSSERYPNQAFRVDSRPAWGLQFHVEITHAAVRAFVEAFAADAGDATGEIAARAPAALAALAPHRDALLGRFAALVATIC